MSYERQGGASLDYQRWSPHGGRLALRGPRPDLSAPYVAFVGGSEFFAPFVSRPLAARVEARLGLCCLNMGAEHAGVEAFVRDEAVLALAAEAGAVVIQAMGVQYLSNRYYKVHPRRNDRIIGGTPTLMRLFPEVDFTAYHFTNHLLGDLQACSPERFGLVLEDLRGTWRKRMDELRARMRGPIYLLWLADHPPEEAGGICPLQRRPFGLTRAMLDALAQEGVHVVEAVASPAAMARGYEGMVLRDEDLAMSRHHFGPFVFEEAAEALAPILGEVGVRSVNTP